MALEVKICIFTEEDNMDVKKVADQEDQEEARKNT